MKSNLSTANSQFIVYGLDETGKAKAGRFTHKESDAAKEAAASMKLNIREVVPPQADDLLKQIPSGRIHAKGKAFIAYVKRELYDQVIAEIGQHLAEPQSGENPLTLSLARTKADQASALPTAGIPLPRVIWSCFKKACLPDGTRPLLSPATTSN